MKHVLFAILASFALGGCTQQMSPAASTRVVRILAASSLTDALTEAGTAFEGANSGVEIEECFAGSGQLKTQIENGAPADMFVCASAIEMDALSKKGLIVESSRAVLISNRLALIAPETNHLKVWGDLALSDIKRIAIANPASVPAGRYAKATLIRRNLWNAVRHKAVYGENVRQVLKYVQAGDVDAGIVFRSDVAAKGSGVKIVEQAANGVDHVAIEYPIAVLRNAKNPGDSTKFARFLLSQDGQTILISHGFTSAASTVTR